MRRLFLYEFVTGGGWYSVDPTVAPPVSLLREGRAMLQALASDLAAMPETHVVVLQDSRLPNLDVENCPVHTVRSSDEEQQLIRQMSSKADGTILIAPEFERLLLQRARWVEEAGGRLLSPSSEVIDLCGDKQRTEEHLAAAGVCVPEGFLAALNGNNEGEVHNEIPGISFPFPIVLKRNDGAGSQGTRLLKSHAEFESVWNELRRNLQRAGTNVALCSETGRPFAERKTTMIEGTIASNTTLEPHEWRIERFCPGVATSVAVLCGPKGNQPLLPCTQELSTDGNFQYLGGECPLPSDLAQRATRLAMDAVATLPSPVGYVGVDLVLGDNPNGTADVVIEINPRLTTSYVGLRQVAKTNLAAAMLEIASGDRFSTSFSLEFSGQTVQFTSAGGVHVSLCGGFEGWAADERAAGAGAKIFVQASIFTEAGRAKL